MSHPKDIASEYIRANFRPDDRLAIVLIHKRSGVVTTRVSTAEKIASAEYQAWLKHMNSYQNRQEVYVSMNSLRPGARGRTKAEIGDIRHVYLDFDENGAENLEALRERADIPEPNHILITSPGKFQVIWRVDEFRKEQAEELMRGMTRSFGSDPAATDCTRVLRIPGFHSHKYASPHFVTVENLSDAIYRPSAFPDITTIGPSPDMGAEGRGTSPKSGRCGATGGSQSERDWAFALWALDRGEQAEEVVRAIEAHRMDKPNPRYYAEHTVAKAEAHRQMTTSTDDRGRGAGGLRR
jgi:hypothetical protein